MLVRILKRVLASGNRVVASDESVKRSAELQFWREEIKQYQKWFRGELSPLYKTPSPHEHEKVMASNEKDASILTWHKLHQEVKYLEDLDLRSDAFQGMKLLELGFWAHAKRNVF